MNAHASPARERERLILSYRYLCKRGARKFLRADVESGDLEQVAAIGLIKACDRYDRSLPTPFEAYAWSVITGELMNHIRAHKRTRRDLPAHAPARRTCNLAERVAFQRAIASLSQNERHIICGVYGHGLAQTAIALRLSLSARHVCRLHRRALGTLQHHLAD